MTEEELDAAVADYRSKKRCIGHCDRVLPNTDEFFATRVRADRGDRKFVKRHCRDCTRSDKRAADECLSNELSPEPGFEMTTAEIAKTLGMTRQWVDKTLNSALNKLRKRLRKEEL